MGKIRHSTRWGRTPRVGTSRNFVFRLLLRRQGVTAEESRMTYRNFQSSMARFRDECGFDIRSYGYNPTIYKIVGREKWGGGYVSFVRLESYEDVQ